MTYEEMERSRDDKAERAVERALEKEHDARQARQARQISLTQRQAQALMSLVRVDDG
jgi:hypothetical protein